MTEVDVEPVEELGDVWEMTMRGLRLWQDRAGLAAVTAWCRLHNLDPAWVVAESVRIYDDGRLRADVYKRNAEGRKYLDASDRPAVVQQVRLLVCPPPPYVLRLVGAPVTMAEARDAALGTVRPEWVDRWLTSRNQLLGGRSPVELVEAGGGQRVLDLCDGMDAGVFV